jgi:hypothetical protein
VLLSLAEAERELNVRMGAADNLGKELARLGQRLREFPSKVEVDQKVRAALDADRLRP